MLYADALWPVRVDYSFITVHFVDGKEIIGRGHVRTFDVEKAMAGHAGAMEQSYAGV